MSPVIGYFGLDQGCKGGSPMWDNRSPSMYHFKRHYLNNGNSWNATPIPQSLNVNGAKYDPGATVPDTNRTNSYFPQIYAFLCSEEYFYFEVEEYAFLENKLEFTSKQYRRVKGLGIPSTENKTLIFKTGYLDSFVPRRGWSGATGTTYYVKSREAENYVFDETDRTVQITKNNNYEYDTVTDSNSGGTLFKAAWLDNTIQGKLLDVAIYKKG